MGLKIRMKKTQKKKLVSVVSFLNRGCIGLKEHSVLTYHDGRFLYRHTYIHSGTHEGEWRKKITLFLFFFFLLFFFVSMKFQNCTHVSLDDSTLGGLRSLCCWEKGRRNNADWYFILWMCFLYSSLIRIIHSLLSVGRQGR